ncbi:MAG: hypothetical protein Q8P15_03070 [Nanoarchaeota archaeon]|nr:hypothetical protein [Nanoarchaeota archaeon]
MAENKSALEELDLYLSQRRSFLHQSVGKGRLRIDTLLENIVGVIESGEDVNNLKDTLKKYLPKYHSDLTYG